MPADAPVPAARSGDFDAEVGIVGGGLAGSALARHLARAGVSVVLVERRRGPEHVLCGEFLSVEVQELLRDLGLLAAVEEAGATVLRQSRMTSPTGREARLALPGTALGLSRYRLDPLLLDAARAGGATVLDGTVVRRIDGDPETGFTLACETTDGAARSLRVRVAVGAHGKRSNVDGALGRAFLATPTPWVGCKAHFEGDDLDDAVELHASGAEAGGAYVGMAHVEDARVNVCWIGRADDLRRAGSPDAWLAAMGATNPHLAARLARLARVTPYRSVAQVSFAAKPLVDRGVVMVGDAAGMIAPLCGDGMAMALSGAALLAPRLARLVAGDVDRAAFETGYAVAWQEAFRTRLRLGRLLHRVATHPAAAHAAVAACRVAPGAGAWVVRHTRG